ncbi:hypothetical protein PR202_ga24191 [Eleusine coracana subsp. coracana]|uniref:Vesicle transport protein n=1 Tax=Eleusine coracana subsp. coracana TaxID=191504 RepID=A0AAV5D8L9_ELECO|nr:hypothetical protein PR202_ga24191 [Eleusine coracana subsp. coracana]
MDALSRLRRSLVGGDEEELPEDSILGDTEDLCSLSPLQRVYAFAICLVVGLALMILIHDKLLTLIAIICEICALFWYSLSYIPFARRMVSDLMVKLCDTEL